MGIKRKPGDENRPSSVARKALPTEDPSSAMQLASEVKNAYVNCRRTLQRSQTGYPSRYMPASRYDGVPDDPDEPESKSRPNTWLAIARRLYLLHHDPVDYITRCFGMLQGTTSSPLLPEDFLDEDPDSRASRLWALASVSEQESVRIAFKFQREMASQFLSQCGIENEERAFGAMLVCSHLALSSLFRYCCAYNTGKHKRFKWVLDTYHDSAVIQYMQAREHYDQVWREFIPETFKAEAQRQYRTLVFELD